ncbi:ATP-binding protein [Hymenobacter sp. GOD-10R]|uniref:ATP-binding response regulator n=1 Tax=Hymenobacter sp. GOD-10R TaxID=3093922 RepID=UPI002D78FBA3|nr:ATP-binding protein [Hymenobacter sp. GOD-10R]WRQ31118.1 ATP-binding protein [Hymenobacter sp. GOD-10R]
MASASATSLLVYLRWVATGMQAHWRAELGFTIGSLLGGMLLLTFVYSVCRITLSRRWLTGVGLAQACLLAAWLMRPDWTLTSVALGLSLVLWLDMFRVIAQAMRQHQPGIWLVALGTFGALLVPFIANGVWRSGPFDVAQQLMLQSCLLLLPICMSVYLAREFAATRRDLEAQLRQVAQLSAQTLAQQAEKHQLISAQNDRLEATVQERTEEISQQNHILAAQRDEITAQADRLRALDQEKTRFFTNITHEFRTPLTLMLGPAAQIAADTQEPTTRQQATLVEGNARRLLHLVNQLLDLSRLEAGQQALHATPGDLVGFVRGLVGSFESLAQQRGIAYSFTAEPAELWGRFDADKLEKVVVNLLSNAFKFTPSVGEVMVRLHAAPPVPGTPTWVELTVRDTGRGIAAAHLPHVFDRFYQADASSTREYEGTGIGLALTKELVELHGGTIALTSEPGCGTTAVVRLLLPHAEETVAAVSNEPAGAYAATAISELTTQQASLPTEAALEAPLILLIEDNADMRAYVSTVLEQDYQLLTAKDGEEGVVLACEHLPDLVLTDAMMPRLDGYGVCRELKHDERTSHIPIVLLTAKADLPSKLHGLDTGVDAYLTKPFQRAELLA